MVSKLCKLDYFTGEGIDERKLSILCYILFNTVYTLEVISKDSQI
jgi:hypothetical protein